VKFHEELAVNVVAPGALLQGLLPLLRKRDTKKVVFTSSAMGSSTVASSIIGRVLKGEPKPATEDFFDMNTYCCEKSALTMQAIVRYMRNTFQRSLLIMFVLGMECRSVPRGFYDCTYPPGLVSQIFIELLIIYPNTFKL
jgi:NAD(P)-dependent dehydrogenase (short-subunit alcohol dehydrogenase family)